MTTITIYHPPCTTSAHPALISVMVLFLMCTSHTPSPGRESPNGICHEGESLVMVGSFIPLPKGRICDPPY